MTRIDFNRLPELESGGSASGSLSRTEVMPDVADVIVAVITGSGD